MSIGYILFDCMSFVSSLAIWAMVCKYAFSLGASVNPEKVVKKITKTTGMTEAGRMFKYNGSRVTMTGTW